MGKNIYSKKLKPILRKYPAVFSALTGFSFMFFLILTAALIFFLFDLNFEDGYMASIFIYVTASISAGFICGRKTKEKGLLSGGTAGILLYFISFIISLFFTNSITADAIYKLIICTLSGAIGGILGVNKRKKKKKRL